MLAKLAGYTGKAVLSNLDSIVTTVGSLLTHKNKVILEIENETDNLNLTLLESYHSSGRYETSPDGTVYPHTASVFSSESRDGSILTGAIGCVVYAVGTGAQNLAIYYSCPSIGGYKANAYVYPGMMGHNAELWYSLLSDSGNKLPYTESSAHRTNMGLTISYSAGEQSTFSLTNALSS